MKKLHICFISQEYPPDTGWGGIGSYTYEMAHGLVKMGHRVSVIAAAAGAEKIINDNEITLYRVLSSPDWNKIPGGWRLARIWPGFAWTAMKTLQKIHRQSPVDVVEACDNKADGFFISYLCKRPPLVIRLHTPWVFIDQLGSIVPDKNKKILYWLEKQAILRADLVTSPSQGMVDLTQTWISLDRKKVCVVPNPIDANQFTVKGLNRRKEVLFAARLERRKGISTLVQSLPQVLKHDSSVTFRFVGKDDGDNDGRPWKDKILEKIAPSDCKRIFFEKLPRTELVARYSEAAVCVLPSRWENFPYTLLEAMACGTPVIGTQTGGLPEIVEDGISGLLVPPDHPEALTKAILELISNPEKREQMGQNARRRIREQFNTDKVVQEMLQVYESILK